jgi:Xaa-Pro dipeptidase
MRRRDDMTFPMEEHERRLSELRKRMEERLLDAVIISDPENLFYLTEYQTTGYSYFQCVVVPLEGDPFMVMRQIESSNVFARSWVDEIEYYPDTGDAIQTLYTYLKKCGLNNKRIGYERNSYFFPAYQQDRVRTALDHHNLIDCFGIVEEGRICKSEIEIEVMKKAAFATEAGVRAGVDAIDAGVTENDVAAAISDGMFRAGGEYPAVMPYVTSGPRSMIGHATWEGREILDGDHVFIEVGGCFRRYHTAMMRTICVGKPNASMREAEQVMLNTLDELHAFIKPGVTVSDVDNLARNMINENNTGAYLITRAGYSIGIAFAPSWDEGYMLSLKQGDAAILKTGMTIHLIPWMWGIDGNKTAGISDTIYITEDGCKSFFSLDRHFVIK